MSQLKRDTFWNTLGSAMYGANSFLMLVMVSNTASLSTTGSFSISWTTAQMLYIIGLFGANFYQMTDYKEEYSFSDYFWLRLWSCGLMVLGCLLYALQRNEKEKVFYLVILTIYMIVNAVGEIYQSFYFQQLHVDVSGQILFFRTLIPFCAFALFQVTIRNLVLSLIVMLAVNLIITALYAKQSRTQGGTSILRPKAKCLIKLFKSCFPLFISAFLMILIVNLPRYVVEWKLTDEMQGYFSLLFIPAQVINMLSQFVFKPLLNGYSVLIEQKKYLEFWKSLLKQFIFIVAFTAVCCLGGAILGIPFLSWVYGANLNGYVEILVIIILGGGALAAAQLMYYILVLIRQQRRIMLIYGVVALAAFPGTWVLVEKTGLWGAASSIVVVHLLTMLLELLGVYFAVKKMPRAKESL